MNNEYEEEIIKLKKEKLNERLIKNITKCIVAIIFISYVVIKVDELNLEEIIEQEKSIVISNINNNEYSKEKYEI